MSSLRNKILPAKKTRVYTAAASVSAAANVQNTAWPLLSSARVQQAWNYFVNDKAIWQAGITRNDMEKQHLLYLLDLINELKSGNYQPDYPRRINLEKPDGSPRPIAILTLRDKFVQRLILMELGPQLEPHLHPDSYAYRVNYSREGAQKAVQKYISAGFDYLVDADISNFYDNIPVDRLLDQLKPAIDNEQLYRLIEKILKAHAPHNKGGRKVGLSQGAVLSPMIANWYLNGLDWYLHEQGIHFVRYADNIMLCVENAKAQKSALKTLEHGLDELELMLNTQKTALIPPGEVTQWLGIEIAATVEKKAKNKSENNGLSNFFQFFRR